MDYIDELNVLDDISNYKLVLCKNSLWITNFIKIMDYTTSAIRLKIKDNVLVIEGVNFKIKMLDKKELILQGRFNKIYLEKEYKVNECEESIKI